MMKMIEKSLVAICVLMLAGYLTLLSESGNDYVKVSPYTKNYIYNPGDTLLIGINFKMKPGWHVYWKNPGDAGLAPDFKWKLPEGLSFIDTLWQYPEQIPFDEFLNFGYQDEMYVFFKALTSKKIKADSIDLICDVGFLVCKEKCIPGKQSLDIKIAKSGSMKGAHEVHFGNPDPLKSAFRKLPAEPRNLSYSAFIVKDTLTLKIKTSDGENIKGNKFGLFPEETGMYLYSTAKTVERTPHEIVFRVTLDNYREHDPDKIYGLVVSDQPFFDTIDKKAIEFETAIIKNK